MIVSEIDIMLDVVDEVTSRDRVHPGCGHVVKMIPVPTINTARPQHMCQAFSRRSSNVEKTLRLFCTAVQG